MRVSVLGAERLEATNHENGSGPAQLSDHSCLEAIRVLHVMPFPGLPRVEVTGWVRRRLPSLGC
jgi:hypothetical protein